MNLWAVGRNYVAHAKELGNEVPAEPLIFLKAGSCATFGERIVIPGWAKDVHHELEFAFEFDKDLQFTKMALALDLTERTLQARLKSNGEPWTLAKSFTGACPLSVALPYQDGVYQLQLSVNGEVRQAGSSTQMVFTPEVLRRYVTAHFPVRPGDWLLTGTPKGVGPLKNGDAVEGLMLSQSGEKLITAQWKVHQS